MMLAYSCRAQGEVFFMPKRLIAVLLAILYPTPPNLWMPTFLSCLAPRTIFSIRSTAGPFELGDIPQLPDVFNPAERLRLDFDSSVPTAMQKMLSTLFAHWSVATAMRASFWTPDDADKTITVDVRYEPADPSISDQSSVEISSKERQLVLHSTDEQLIRSGLRPLAMTGLQQVALENVHWTLGCPAIDGMVFGVHHSMGDRYWQGMYLKEWVDRSPGPVLFFDEVVALPDTPDATLLKFGEEVIGAILSRSPEIVSEPPRRQLDYILTMMNFAFMVKSGSDYPTSLHDVVDKYLSKDRERSESKFVSGIGRLSASPPPTYADLHRLRKNEEFSPSLDAWPIRHELQTGHVVYIQEHWLMEPLPFTVMYTLYRSTQPGINQLREIAHYMRDWYLLDRASQLKAAWVVTHLDQVLPPTKPTPLRTGHPDYRNLLRLAQTHGWKKPLTILSRRGSGHYANLQDLSPHTRFVHTPDPLLDTPLGRLGRLHERMDQLRGKGDLKWILLEIQDALELISAFSWHRLRWDERLDFPIRIDADLMTWGIRQAQGWIEQHGRHWLKNDYEATIENLPPALRAFMRADFDDVSTNHALLADALDEIDRLAGGSRAANPSALRLLVDQLRSHMSYEKLLEPAVLTSI